MMLTIHVVASFLSTVAFGILTNIPRRALLASGITGCLGWLVYVILQASNYGLGITNFAATFVIGCLSVFFSRKKKIPMIIFTIPALVPLVPGGPAYKAVRELVLGNNFAAFENIMVVIITAGSIAAAFMMTSLVERILLKWRQAQRNRKLKKTLK